jgi:hypothetical protein
MSRNAVTKDVLDTVESGDEEAVVRQSSVGCDGKRQALRCEPVAPVRRHEDGGPLLHRHLTGLVVA